MAETRRRDALENNQPRRSEWLAATIRAMLASLLAVAASVLVVCGVHVAVQREQARTGDVTSVTQCIVSPDGKRAIALWWNVPTTLEGWTHRVSLHSTEAGQTAAAFQWPEVTPSCVSAGATDDEIIVGGWNGAIHAIRGAPQVAEPELIGQHADGVLQLEIAANGLTLISLSPTTMCAWDLPTRQLLWKRDGGQVSCFGIHPDSTWLACGMNDGTIAMRNLQHGTPLGNLLANTLQWPVHDLDFACDGRRLAIAHSSGDVRIVDCERPVQHPGDGGEPFCTTGWPRLAKFSHCGTMLAAVAPSDKPELILWNVQSGQRALTLRGHKGIILGAVFARDGRLFSWGNDATIRIWDTQRGETIGVVSLAYPSDLLSGRRGRAVARLDAERRPSPSAPQSAPQPQQAG